MVVSICHWLVWDSSLVLLPVKAMLSFWLCGVFSGVWGCPQPWWSPHCQRCLRCVDVALGDMDRWWGSIDQTDGWTCDLWGSNLDNAMILIIYWKHGFFSLTYQLYDKERWIAAVKSTLFNKLSLPAGIRIAGGKLPRLALHSAFAKSYSKAAAWKQLQSCSKLNTSHCFYLAILLKQT